MDNNTLTIAGMFIGMLAFIYTFIHKLENKLDASIAASNARIDQVNTRMDQFYQMFIDLLKDKKKGE